MTTLNLNSVRYAMLDILATFGIMAFVLCAIIGFITIVMGFVEARRG